MSEVYHQVRPDWCPHETCQFSRRVTDAMCVGQLPQPEPHDGGFNTHRMCLNGAADDGGVFDLQINKTDVWWFRWLFDAIFPLALEAKLSKMEEQDEIHWKTRRTLLEDKAALEQRVEGVEEHLRATLHRVEQNPTENPECIGDEAWWMQRTRMTLALAAEGEA